MKLCTQCHILFASNYPHQHFCSAECRIIFHYGNPRSKAQVLAANQKIKRNLKEAVLNKFGRCCKRCGFSDVRALQIDHVKGNGAAESRKFHGGIYLLKRVLADTEGRYQLLCANCNWIKRAENREFEIAYKTDSKP